MQNIVPSPDSIYIEPILAINDVDTVKLRDMVHANRAERAERAERVLVRPFIISSHVFVFMNPT